MTTSFWQAVLFDFDGVILESVPARTAGFRRLFDGHPAAAVEALIRYHEENGGLSRYHKIEYFFAEILKQELTPVERDGHAARFSALVTQAVIDSPYISGALEFVCREQPFPMHLVSGSDQEELRLICGRLDIAARFAGIFGSPTPKIRNVADVLAANGYEAGRTVLVGDSHNDLEAARANKISFIARAPAGAVWAAGGDARIDDLLGLDRALDMLAERSV